MIYKSTKIPFQLKCGFEKNLFPPKSDLEKNLLPLVNNLLPPKKNLLAPKINNSLCLPQNQHPSSSVRTVHRATQRRRHRLSFAIELSVSALHALHLLHLQVALHLLLMLMKNCFLQFQNSHTLGSFSWFSDQIFIYIFSNFLFIHTSSQHLWSSLKQK